jgi:hypothetical protein
VRDGRHTGTTLGARLRETMAAMTTRDVALEATLRAEELAELTGSSIDYVVRLEPGRAARPPLRADTEAETKFRLAVLAGVPDPVRG